MNKYNLHIVLPKRNKKLSVVYGISVLYSDINNDSQPMAFIYATIQLCVPNYNKTVLLYH